MEYFFSSQWALRWCIVLAFKTYGNDDSNTWKIAKRRWKLVLKWPLIRKVINVDFSLLFKSGQMLVCSSAFVFFLLLIFKHFRSLSPNYGRPLCEMSRAISDFHYNIIFGFKRLFFNLVWFLCPYLVV